jgi:hypothetical protein
VGVPGTIVRMVAPVVWPFLVIGVARGDGALWPVLFNPDRFGDRRGLRAPAPALGVGARHYSERLPRTSLSPARWTNISAHTVPCRRRGTGRPYSRAFYSALRKAEQGGSIYIRTIHVPQPCELTPASIKRSARASQTSKKPSAWSSRFTNWTKC